LIVRITFSTNAVFFISFSSLFFQKPVSSGGASGFGGGFACVSSLSRFCEGGVANIGRQYFTVVVKKDMKEAIGREGRQSMIVKVHGHP
jgi:hypothetical protein